MDSISSGKLRRREVLAGGMALLAGIPSVARAAPMRIVSLDYGLAQTLLELGAVPAGLIDPASWPDWVMEPILPAGIANVGSNQELNMEMLQLLKPDLIISTPYLEWVRPQLETIAPVQSYPIHAIGSSPMPHIVEATRQLGDILGRKAAAEALIGRTEAELARAREQAGHLRDRGVTVVSFLDARNLRVYGPGGIFQDVFDQLDLRNGWTMPTNEWGFSDAGLSELMTLGDSRVFYMDPVPPDVLATLPESPLWQAMPFVRSGNAQRIASVLMFGTLPSYSRFARLLAEA
ncbi:ABC transporter substrate-binding protein [Phyllobacterium sp. 0TCS1.6C]|uniref:ABC transporter substrate-binding protein n=1 Tax=unclassified Phyllobacterium TaxID=2638441 RepID=UPI002263C44F|nr:MULTISPECIES: ABC transporter substrate-binding protein [unclassified Phyllobacterium]MCX8280361.1 ABC transporter substrate-binding protein [Phyllobacterium sp. 0TCS1.6C]MCX8295190.1 ABC transporter substrate-binding protein [Phyllobacterium sp. 0TCS1.6A]